MPGVALLLAGDHAGRVAAYKIRSLLTHGSANIIPLPDEQDPDDLDDSSLTALLNPLLL